MRYTDARDDVMIIVSVVRKPPKPQQLFLTQGCIVMEPLQKHEWVSHHLAPPPHLALGDILVVVLQLEGPG